MWESTVDEEPTIAVAQESFKAFVIEYYLVNAFPIGLRDL